MVNICDLSLLDAARKIKSRTIGVEETVNACLARIEDTEPFLEALITINREKALSIARHMDKTGPDPALPLWGIPVIIKDAISTKDLRTTAASKILENFTPIYDAFCIRKLKEAGAIILAKANMDEFAMGSSTENSAYMKTRNPWDTSRVPGGSSGGSAASIAAAQAFASLGSDTGGSIRQPAAFCGCVGLKPTYGRVSRFGLFAFASSMDQIGPLTKTVLDCAAILDIIAGHDPRDNTSSNKEKDNYLASITLSEENAPLKNIKIGVPKAFFGNGLNPEVRGICDNALKTAEKLGASLISIDLPDPDLASATYYIIAMAEASSNLARYDGVRYGRRAGGVANLEELYIKSRSEGFGQEVKRRIMLGSYILSAGYYDAYFKKAAKIRRIITNQYLKALSCCDVIAMPVAPVPAWPLDSHTLDPLKAYLMDAYTLPANLAGLPAISIPAGKGDSTGLPVGFQLIGNYFDEGVLLNIAYQLERSLPPLGQPPIISRVESQ